MSEDVPNSYHHSHGHTSYLGTNISKLNELCSKEEMDWVVMLLNVLRSKENEDYAKHLL